MKYLTILMSSLLLIAGCSGPHYSDFLPYTDEGILKPRVVVLPVEPCGDEALGSRARYFNEAIRWIALDRNELYLYSKVEVAENRYASSQQDLFQKALCFRPADYVVQIEVLEDEVKPSSEVNAKSVIPVAGMKNRSVACVKLRVQVIDIRCQEGKVILYEIVERSLVLSSHPCQQYVPTSIYEELAVDAMNRIEEVIFCNR